MTLLRSILFFLCCQCALVAAQPTLRFVAEDLPPLHYQNENGQTAGALVDVAHAVLSEADLKGEILLMPMARAYHEMEKDPYTLMMSLLRSEERESAFSWIGQTYEVRANLVGLKRNKELTLNSLEDAKKYRVATIRGYHSATFLRENGFSEDENLVLVKNYKALWQLLELGRIDLILTNTIVLEQELLKARIPLDHVEKKLAINNFPGALYIAANHKLDENIANRLKAALEAIKASGLYTAIMKKWKLDE